MGRAPRTNEATIRALGQLGVSLTDADVNEFAGLLARIAGAPCLHGACAGVSLGVASVRASAGGRECCRADS